MRWSVWLLGVACAADAPWPEGSSRVDTGERLELPWEACPEGASPMEVEVEIGPHSDLTLRVTWTTSRPGTSEVVFGEGTPQWRLADESERTEHEVVLYGLHANTDVALQAVTTFADGSAACSGLRAGRTGPLPPSVPIGKLGAYAAGEMQPGWTLLNVSNRFFEWPPTVVMYDLSGRPVWYVVVEPDAFDQRGDLDVSLTPDGRVLVGGSGNAIRPRAFDLAGRIVWWGPPQVDPVQHHHFQQEPDGTYVYLRHGVDDRYPGMDLTEVVQIDADLETTWSWDPYEHLGGLGVAPAAEGDVMHGNSATVDGDHVYLNSRNLGRLFKLSRSTGEILWALGRRGDFAADPEADSPWFRSQHDPELQDDGSWLFYDNAGLSDQHSRILQLAIDEDALTTEVVWEFPGTFQVDPWYTAEWFSSIWGDADRLPNGHVLVTAGTRTAGKQSRVFEVTPEGQVVWEMLLPAGVGWGLSATTGWSRRCVPTRHPLRVALGPVQGHARDAGAHAVRPGHPVPAGALRRAHPAGGGRGRSGVQGAPEGAAVTVTHALFVRNGSVVPVGRVPTVLASEVHADLQEIRAAFERV